MYHLIKGFSLHTYNKSSILYLNSKHKNVVSKNVYDFMISPIYSMEPSCICYTTKAENPPQWILFTFTR